MISARAMANQSLYYAKVLMDSWRDQLQQAVVPARVLNVAFGASVCAHLRDAYGWFLLALSDSKTLPDKPPSSVADLPVPEAGISQSAEIREFEQLEQYDWLARLLAAQESPNALKSAPRSSLATTIDSDFDLSLQEDWHRRLEQLFDRMSQSLDEC